MLKFLFFCALFLGQHSFFGPVGEGPAEGSGLIRVQLLVRDSPDPGGLRVTRVSFAGHDVPLKPRGIDGNRGTASFQLRPGTYPLRWTVNRSSSDWPRTVSHEESIELNPRDLWLQITIDGESMTVT